MLKKKINFRRVERKLIGKRVDNLRLEANNIEVGIIKRTQSGKDVNQRRMKPYSAAYKNRRSKENRNTTPDLTRTGAMLQALSNKRITNGIRFYFSASAETKKAFYNNKERNFFGIDKRQIKYLKRKIGKQ